MTRCFHYQSKPAIIEARLLHGASKLDYKYMHTVTCESTSAMRHIVRMWLLRCVDASVCMAILAYSHAVFTSLGWVLPWHPLPDLAHRSAKRARACPYTYVCVYMYVYIYICVYIYTHTCMYECMYVYM